MTADDLPEIRIGLSREEAIVLFEWLSNGQATGALFDALQEPERAALSTLLCRLEEELPEPFLDDYPEHLMRARASFSNKAD
jgi:hypothetical protein